MKHLILNADDFGYSARVNKAVLRAHCEGVLTSASLMVAEEGFAEAVAMARETPTLGVGLHVVTTLDRALLPPAYVSTLVNQEGRFSGDLFRVGVRYGFSQTAKAQLHQEIKAQFARFAETELPWSHVDGHQHFHLHPTVWDTLLDLCDEHGVHRLRMPHEPLRAHFRAGGDGPNLNTVATLFLRALRRRNLRVLRARKTLGGKAPFLCDRVYGQLQTGDMNTDYTVKLLDRLEGHTNEIYFHPGAPHAHPLPVEQQTDGVQDVELAALLASAVRNKIAALGLKVGTYAEIETS